MNDAKIRRLSLLLLVAVWPGSLRAGSLEKAWEIDLKTTLQSQNLGAGQSYKVTKVLFSPDSEQIAVFLLGGDIVLIQTQHPKTVVGKFENDQYDFVFGWSPDSRIIYSGRHVIRLADQKSCDLPLGAIAPHFVGMDSLVAIFAGHSGVGPDGKVDFRHHGPAHLMFFDTDCQEQDSGEVPSKWLVMDASPDRGLLLVSEIVSTPWTTQMIVDPSERRAARPICRQWTCYLRR